ncbi:MAG: hypothetical protein ABID54_01180 [Pseudomonadota bacterium]
MSHGEICWSSGVPIEGEREGEGQPEEAGRGKYSPPANPERVTAEVLERRDKGVHVHRPSPKRKEREL